ncbi:MAG: DEAD/DEAH box helicase [Rhodovarius sp.]|nr:DEAD/DEAH box helicase [Rhodovarius sp.]
MPFPPLPPALAAALAGRDYTEPTPVQSAVLQAPPGRDLLVSARTGSGKTVAFGLAIAQDLLGDAAALPAAGAPLALAIAPTRELALQVAAELGWLYAEAHGVVATCVGGMDPWAERRALQRGVHIVVGTPGRLRDHIERGNLDLSSLRVVVLDEADEMLDLGFREELEAILDAAPARRRTLMFSATVPRPIAELAERYQRDALRLSVQTDGGQHGDIHHQATVIAPQDLERVVVNALRLIDPPLAMVFAGTRAEVARMAGSLAERGFATVALSGEMSQNERQRALQALRDGRARVCVATDVAARGLDLPDLGLVIHADLPRDPETLTHRAGRTGRAGRKGISLLIVPLPRRRQAERLLAQARIRAEWIPAPDPQAVRARDEARLLERAQALLAEAPEEADLALAQRLSAPAASLGAALFRLLRSPLPAPEELTDITQHRLPEPPPGRREGQVVWFRCHIGRQHGADPKWLLPLLCRRGHVGREAIGSIRILQRETRFEVAAEAADRFAEAVARSGRADREVRIEPLPASGRREASRARSGPADQEARRAARGHRERARHDRADRSPVQRRQAQGRGQPRSWPE